MEPAERYDPISVEIPRLPCVHGRSPAAEMMLTYAHNCNEMNSTRYERCIANGWDLNLISRSEAQRAAEGKYACYECERQVLRALAKQLQFKWSVAYGADCPSA